MKTWKEGNVEYLECDCGTRYQRTITPKDVFDIGISSVVRLEFLTHFQNYIVVSYMRGDRDFKDSETGAKRHYLAMTLVSTGSPDVKKAESPRIPVSSSAQEEQPLLWDV